MKKLLIFLIAALSFTADAFSQVRVPDLPELSASNNDSTWMLVSSNRTSRKIRGYKVAKMEMSSGPYEDSVFQWSGNTRRFIGVIRYQDGRYGGCDVTAINDTTYRISAANYRIGGIPYTSQTDTIQVSSNIGSDPLYRVFGVDNTGSAIVIPGTPATNPAIPIPTSSQLGCATVYFPGSSGTPIINNYVTNIQNIGRDSSAYHVGDGVQINDSTILFCNLYGVCDTVKIRYTGGNYIASDGPTTTSADVTVDANGNDFKVLNAKDIQFQQDLGGVGTQYIYGNASELQIGRILYGLGAYINFTDSSVNILSDNSSTGHSLKVRASGIELNPPAGDSLKVFLDKVPVDPSGGNNPVLTYSLADKKLYRTASAAGISRQEFLDSIDSVNQRIPTQFNPIAGTNITISGTYPNITFNATGAGGSQTLDQTLNNGNSTDTTINLVDSLNSGSGKIFFTMYPKGHGTTYGGQRSSSFNGMGYVHYPGVNADGRPNVVMLIAGYNGGYNTPIFSNEATWGLRGETWYQLGGVGHSEFHGFGPEFKPAGSSSSRRLGSYYVNNLTGVTTYNQQLENWNVFRGATDTVQVSSSESQFRVNGINYGSLVVGNSRTNENFAIEQSANGVAFSLNSYATPASAYFTFQSPVQAVTSATIGTGQQAAYQAAVGTAGYYGLKVVQSGLSTSSFGGITADVNTTGTYTQSYVRQLNASGTAEHWINVGNGAIGQYTFSDAAVGTRWRMYIKSGEADRQFKIGFGTSTYDSIMKMRGTDGLTSFRFPVNIGSAAYPQASAALEVTSTTAGFLPPRMTGTQAEAISSPAEGLLIYCTNGNGSTITSKGWWGYDGSTWAKLN